MLFIAHNWHLWLAFLILIWFLRALVLAHLTGYALWQMRSKIRFMVTAVDGLAKLGMLACSFLFVLAVIVQIILVAKS